MRETLNEIAKGALCSRVTLQATFDAAMSLIDSEIPGDFVECGVWAGANAAAMALACQCTLDETRRIHLFDSFEGIPQAGPHDLEYLEAGHPAGLSTCNLGTTMERMQAWGVEPERLVYHPGWFANTVPISTLGVGSIRQVALLRLDGDLYESTKVCIEELYPLVSVGGIVIVDDWTLSGVRKAMREQFGEPGAPGPVYFFKER